MRAAERYDEWKESDVDLLSVYGVQVIKLRCCQVWFPAVPLKATTTHRVVAVPVSGPRLVASHCLSIIACFAAVSLLSQVFMLKTQAFKYTLILIFGFNIYCNSEEYFHVVCVIYSHQRIVLKLSYFIWRISWMQD